MARRIIKKIGGDRIGSGAKMQVQAHGYGYSTHDVSTNLVTSQGFGTIVPHAQFLMPAGSRLRLKIESMVTSQPLFYQLYGSCKIQWDVFEARMALYNAKMNINLQDAGYEVDDVKFPIMKLKTRGFINEERMTQRQVNTSTLLFMLGVVANGQNELDPTAEVERAHMAMWLLMYYQTVKEYYANKQEGIGYMIHNTAITRTIFSGKVWDNSQEIATIPFETIGTPIIIDQTRNVRFNIDINDDVPAFADILITIGGAGGKPAGEYPITELFQSIQIQNDGTIQWIECAITFNYPDQFAIRGWQYAEEEATSPKLAEYDLKAIDRMTMKIQEVIQDTSPLTIDEDTELPYGASFKKYGDMYSINTSQEGLCLGTYQSDRNQNWLDNTKINALTSRTKVKVDENGEFSINQLQIIQKMYNVDMRIAITDGTLTDWREMTYGVKATTTTLKPTYVGGLSKEIVFNMVVSTAGTTDEPLASIASRGTLGAKHKGGYVQVEAAHEEKLVMVLCKITPRIRYSQGNDWTTNLKTLDDLHKPGLDKIAYQNLLTDQVFAADTVVKADGTLITRSLGKQPAWQNYRTNLDRAAGFPADQEDYKVFGRKYEGEKEEAPSTGYRLKDGTTYIDPIKFNEVFADASLEAMNFDVETDIEAKLTLVMSEEVIPGI